MKKYSRRSLARQKTLKFYTGQIASELKLFGLAKVLLNRSGHHIFTVASNHTTLPKGVDFDALVPGKEIVFRDNGFGCVKEVLKINHNAKLRKPLANKLSCKKYEYYLRIHAPFLAGARDLAYRKMTRWPNWSPPPRVQKHALKPVHG